jgi:cellulose synthase/poly-beta-1,6-N-acetylglucosamine synthase-like glycosyltransferase
MAMLELNVILLVLQWSILAYVVAVQTAYFALNVSSFLCASRYIASRVLDALPRRYADSDLRVSLLVPAYNEEATIAATIRSLLQVNFAEVELVIINDGSHDQTLEVLKKDFALVPIVEAFETQLTTKPIRRLYASSLYPSIKVIDKENGGKADALNAGINFSRNPLFCSIDADSILERDSLHRAVQPFLDNPDTVACSGTVRVVNGCKVRRGFLVETGLPHNPLALFQVVEYIRAFLFGRLAWLPLNSILIIPGAFGVFRRRSVLAVGGYRTDTVGEDMDLVLRLHRDHRLQGKAYSIGYAPEAICWTEVPERVAALKAQRIRWQRGLSESLRNNRQLLFHPKGGSVSWLAFPFMVLFEWLSPVLETGGYVFMSVGCFLGFVRPDVALIFFILAVGLGALNSASALFLDELIFHRYPKLRHILILFFVALLENVGYRQLTAVWRVTAFIGWVRGRPATWGAMTRGTSWQIR